jgi:hypothetical protein
MSTFSRFALAALVLTVPVSSFAGTDAAVDACLQTFLESDLAKDRKVSVRKNLDAAPRPVALSGDYQVEVVAKGRESGKRLAHIVCRVDAKGTIVAVTGRPTSAVATVAQAR